MIFLIYEFGFLIIEGIFQFKMKSKICNQKSSDRRVLKLFSPF